MYITSKVTIGQKTQCAGQFDRIVEPPGRDIGLPDHRDTRVGSAHELAFHCSERYRLVPSDHLGLLVARWKGNQKGRDEPSPRSRAQIELSLDRMQLPQRIQRADCCDYERACYQSRYLIVRELDQGPRIQQVGTKTPDGQ